MSIQNRLALVSGLPGLMALVLYFLASNAQAPGDGRRLFWYATMLAGLGTVWGLVAWLFHQTRRHDELHDDEISDLRCVNRQLAKDVEALSHAMAALVESRPVGHMDVPVPVGRLYALPSRANEG